MERIEKNEVKMKPRWWFVAKMEAMNGGVVVLMLLGVWLWALMVYNVEINTPIELLDYGELGREIIFEDFPYVFLISGLVLATGAGLLFSRIGDHYKRPMKVIMGMTTLGLVTLTIVVTIIRKLSLF